MILEETFKLVLVDYDNQVMNLISSSQIKLLSVTNKASLVGTGTSSITINGVATFDDIGFEYLPGAESIIFKASSSSIDSSKTSYLTLPTDNSATVSFRYCKPGEIIFENTK